MHVKLIERMESGFGYECIGSYTVETPKHRMGLHNMSDCPEDASLERDLGAIFTVEDMIREAYEAGKNGEKLTFEAITEED